MVLQSPTKRSLGRKSEPSSRQNYHVSQNKNSHKESDAPKRSYLDKGLPTKEQVERRNLLKSKLFFGGSGGDADDSTDPLEDEDDYVQNQMHNNKSATQGEMNLNDDDDDDDDEEEEDNNHNRQDVPGHRKNANTNANQFACTKDRISRSLSPKRLTQSLLGTSRSGTSAAHNNNRGTSLSPSSNAAGKANLISRLGLKKKLRNHHRDDHHHNNKNSNTKPDSFSSSNGGSGSSSSLSMEDKLLFSNGDDEDTNNNSRNNNGSFNRQQQGQANKSGQYRRAYDYSSLLSSPNNNNTKPRTKTRSVKDYNNHIIEAKDLSGGLVCSRPSPRRSKSSGESSSADILERAARRVAQNRKLNASNSNSKTKKVLQRNNTTDGNGLERMQISLQQHLEKNNNKGNSSVSNIDNDGTGSIVSGLFQRGLLALEKLYDDVNTSGNKDSKHNDDDDE